MYHVRSLRVVVAVIGLLSIRQAAVVSTVIVDAITDGVVVFEIAVTLFVMVVIFFGECAIGTATEAAIAGVALHSVSDSTGAPVAFLPDYTPARCVLLPILLGCSIVVVCSPLECAGSLLFFLDAWPDFAFEISTVDVATDAAVLLSGFAAVG